MCVCNVLECYYYIYYSNSRECIAIILYLCKHPFTVVDTVISIVIWICRRRGRAEKVFLHIKNIEDSSALHSPPTLSIALFRAIDVIFDDKLEFCPVINWQLMPKRRWNRIRFRFRLTQFNCNPLPYLTNLQQTFF